MGARPVAVMDALRFGPADAPDTHRVLPGVVGGISFYGNCLGLPNIGGELAFDPCYAGNPLVNALCVGVHAARRPEARCRDRAGQQGHPVRLADRARRHRRCVGAGQASFGGGSEGAKRPSVQVGDPFMEKLLVECCLELYAGRPGRRHPGPRRGRGGVRDDGAGGGRRYRHARPTGRRAAAGLIARSARDPDERVAGADDGGRHARRRGALPADLCSLGRAGDGHRRGDRHRPAGDVLARCQVVDIPPGSAADEGPVCDRPAQRPASQDALQADDPSRLPRPGPGIAPACARPCLQSWARPTRRTRAG